MSDASDPMYPTQFLHKAPGVQTIRPIDYGAGAPHRPLSKSFYQVDPRLAVCGPPVDEAEVSRVLALRSAFRVGDYPDPYIADILRAFRLLRGKRAYLEIGTFDRGNLAYVSSILSEDAHLLGIDLQKDDVRDSLLREKLFPAQTYSSIVGSSRGSDTVEQVKAVLQGSKLDAMFIDGDHTAYGTMSDYALYEEVVAPDGIIMFHDSVWEGDEQYKGVCDALAEIDRLDPVYLVDGVNPSRRFLRPLWRDELWGVVGIVFASSQAWRR
jgi:predicted O-methyltransferase YrrM